MNSSDQIDRLSKESTDLFLAFYGQLLDIDFLDELAIREKIRTRADVKRLCLRLMDRLQTERDRILSAQHKVCLKIRKMLLSSQGKTGLHFRIRNFLRFLSTFLIIFPCCRLLSAGS